jgi:DNA-binding NarL/FixJ family response regulator
LVLDPGEGSLRPTLDVFVLVSVRLYRDGIADALRRDPRFRVVGCADSLETAQAELAELPLEPAVALVDLGMHGGVGVTRVLCADWPDLRIVALAVREADEDVVRWAEAGVAGIVSREATLAELLNAVEAAARDQVITSPAVAGALLRRVSFVAHESHLADAPMLTRREREIVRLIGRGLSNKEIATVLRIELPTVKNHVHNILEKLRVGGRSEAVSAAQARGELDRI